MAPKERSLSREQLCVWRRPAGGAPSEHLLGPCLELGGLDLASNWTLFWLLKMGRFSHKLLPGRAARLSPGAARGPEASSRPARAGGLVAAWKPGGEAGERGKGSGAWVQSKVSQIVDKLGEGNRQLPSR